MARRIEVGIRAGREDAAGRRLVRRVRGDLGLRVDDVIVAIQGQEVRSSTQFIVQLRHFRAGDRVEITYFRGTEKETVNVTLGPRPDNL